MKRKAWLLPMAVLRACGGWWLTSASGLGFWTSGPLSTGGSPLHPQPPALGRTHKGYHQSRVAGVCEVTCKHNDGTMAAGRFAQVYFTPWRRLCTMSLTLVMATGTFGLEGSTVGK